jgi:penicillin-binding protein 1B
MSQLIARLREFFRYPSIRRPLMALVALVTLAIIALIVWLVNLDRDISRRFTEKRFAPPIEFYSSAEAISAGAKYPSALLEALFARRSYTKREFSQSMSPGDYSSWSGDECRQFLGDAVSAKATPEPSLDQALANATPAPGAPAAPQSLSADSIAKCIVFANRGQIRSPAQAIVSTTDSPESRGQIIALTADGVVIGTYDRETKQALQQGVIEPELFAQYYGDKPVLRNVITIASGEVPPLCLNALIAIEDAHFYEHSGVSFTGLLRAAVMDLRGRHLQGGSTLTQQLVKNYFLSDERTIKRKVTEIAMAFLVEHHASKDDILETYINLIYMGQNGPFEVRGFSAAAQHYFAKPLKDLNLPECALLAGILNGPGVYDPQKHPDKALKRRAHVLERMADLNFIDQQKRAESDKFPLPSKPQRSLTEPAPYFVQAVRRELDQQKIQLDDGARIFTTLNIRAQEAAQQAVRQGLDRLETTNKTIMKIKATGKSLEAVLVSSDPETGYIQALVGGRGFTATQYNRATDAHRQVGSVMKPFVYLTAYEGMDSQGQPYTPLTLLADKPTTHKFENQVWTPKNFEGTYNGDVPMYYALKESLNAATVNLGMAIGVDNVIETAKRMGITSKLQPYPSVFLGAFEISPLEVLEAYGTVARFGQKTPLTMLAKVEDLNGRELYKFESKHEQVASPDAVAELIGTMKQTINSGTGRGAKLAGFIHPAAGKSGTTNDQKDAWFAGYTPAHVAIVWVGYDDNTPHHLTGGSGAVPIWTQYMKAYASSFAPTDFKWPEGTEVVSFTNEQLTAYGVPDTDQKRVIDPVALVFKKGQAPKIPAAGATPAPK